MTKAEQSKQATQRRPQSAQDKQIQAADCVVDGRQALPDPVLDTGDASYQLSEMNRTRLQRWNSSLGKAPRAGSAAAELFRAAQVAGNGEPYSFFDDASTMEKAAIYGVGAALALAALPEYVVVGADPGSKYKKAKELGVTILNESEFQDLLGSCSPD